ncbi:Glucosamine kinase GspK [Aquicella siphonis]|uniref:Glucosamine kinase GspK n=1 Tax=Aquicella siphonis TaxID=254247 RepID=A0A5E4PE65_9COXI|nr:BadF/BadG/BcrA/BcrD ATPase family protein [Aquicella siphonis]VVC75114.1 Glucosamine kinase GspK [Aquicella siphonis]
MTQSFYIGVDGGATKCLVSVEDEHGNLLGRETGGPANIRLSVPQAWQSIHAALEKILSPLAIQMYDKRYHWHAGMGLAGCEIEEAYQAFLAVPHEFETLILTSDAHTACLGAHAGHDGAVIIIGTGVVGFQVQSGETSKVGGWGFPHDDEGGGAWLGLEAVRLTLQTLDGRQPVNELTQAVFAFFGSDLGRFVTWANQANSTAFAELAPVVIHCAAAGSEAARNLMRESAKAVDGVAAALQAARENQDVILPCSLAGGMAAFIEPYLNNALRAQLVPCQSTPDAGAVFLVRNYLAKSNIKTSPGREGTHD